jgi:V/A-type H+-transporting ATPase subunit D
MARIKLTKNELKAQRDALKRFQRYLPTLQLKKQQLQVEMWDLETLLHTNEKQEQTLRAKLDSWIDLFSEPFDFASHLSITGIEESTDSIAGVTVPVLTKVCFDTQTPDLLTTPPWVDDGIETLQKLLKIQIEWRFLKKQYDLLSEELRVTAQRVNLFEKVKIPETQEHIRTIRIFLGDQQTAAVARAKIAKEKTAAKGAAA